MPERHHGKAKGKNIEMQKIIRSIAVLYLIVSVLVGAVLYNRLEQTRHELGQYRNAAQQLTEYQQSVDAGLQSARECISSATSSVHELREGLRTLEKIFIDLENDNNNLRNYIDTISNSSNKE